MAVAVGVHEAKTHLSRLLRRVEAGEQIEIQSGGRPVALLVPFPHDSDRKLGLDEGRFVIPDDFDAPLPDDFLQAFR
jgi:prevent-host-death family protein